MNELFNDLPDVLDAKALAHALSISKSGAYTLLNQKDFLLSGRALKIACRKSISVRQLPRWNARAFPANAATRIERSSA